MRPFKPVLTLAIALALAACAPQQGAFKKYPNNAAREAAALAGDGYAAYDIGWDACLNEPAADQGRDTVKWLTRATRSHDWQARLNAQQMLGLHYIARVSYAGGPDHEWTYDPRKTKGEVRFCTGSRRSAANDALAEKWLAACASKHYIAQNGCDENLGKLYYDQKKWAKAYKAFVFIAGWHENGIFDYGTFYNGRLSDLPPNKSDIFMADWKRVKPLMQEAAKHLSRAETDRIDAQTRNEIRASIWRGFRNDGRGKVNK
ncbi:MAG: hypothetical protein PSY14_07270 [bacterium]|nr:hypothetical protein [bacterium]